MSFGDDVRKFAQKSGRSLERIVRETELELYRSVINDTPVDEGRLQANWFLSQGAESTETTDNVGRNAVGSVETGLAAMPFPRKSYLTNNLPYAIPIEEGHSTVKAPQGMVRKNIRRITAVMRALVREHKV